MAFHPRDNPAPAPTAPQPSPETAPDWDAKSLQNPHLAADKRDRVRRMFAAIAPSYDLNNRLHSAWIDQFWRRQAVKLAAVRDTDRIVDVACGTGDLTLAFFRRLCELQDISAAAHQILGVDFTYEMLPIARAKYLGPETSDHEGEDFYNADIRKVVHYVVGDAQCLPLPDACADIVSIAFGIRNVQDPLTALREFHRVLRPGGRVIVLEFSVPTNPIFRRVYNFYSATVMPYTATWLSGDRTGAYKYLPHSVETFLTPAQMTALLTQAGFNDVVARPLTFGAVNVYRGISPGRA